MTTYNKKMYRIDSFTYDLNVESEFEFKNEVDLIKLPSLQININHYL